MHGKKGFTLFELIVAMIILTIVAMIVIPNYISNQMTSSARAAQNNLIAVYNAQKNYYYGNNAYCTGGACNSRATINATLSLNITDTLYNYSCTAVTGFTCTATNIGHPALILTVTNNSIVLFGGVGCTAATSGGNCNPGCATDVAAYCPTG